MIGKFPKQSFNQVCSASFVGVGESVATGSLGAAYLGKGVEMNVKAVAHIV